MGNAAATSPDEILFSGAQYRTWGDWTFSITGIPYASYSLVFYEMGPSAHGSQATALTGGPTYYLSQTYASTAAGYVDNNAATPFTYTRATSTTAGTPSVDANYVVFSGLSGGNQTVTIPGGFQIVNPFSAFQIVDTSPPPVTVRTPAASGDDAEESPFGTVALDGATLGIGPNLVGVRFPNLAIPPTAIITSASVQFTAGAAQSGAASFEITAQAIGNAAAFSTTANDIASRAITATSVLWQPAAWNTIGERAAAQLTPDLTAVLAEVLARPGWASGNAVAFFINGTGHRTADAFDDAGAVPAQLQLTYNAGPTPHSYLAWIAGLPSIPAAQRHHTADPDGDNYNNLLEFALGLNPTTPEASPVSILAIPDYLVFTYTRPRVAHGLTYITEWNDDLASNTSSPAGATAQVVNDNGNVQTIRAYIPAASAPHRFVRLRVIQE